MPPGQQARVFAAMLLCGAGAAALHDALSLLRRWMRAGAFAAGAADLAVGAAAAWAMTLAALHLGVNPFRLYAFAGVFVGAGLWLGTVGLLWRKAVARAARRMRKPQENCRKRTE